MSLTFLLLFLMQSPKHIIGWQHAPPCRDIALSIESVQPLHPDFRFRATIRNNSSAPFLLAAPMRIWWDLTFRTPRGWKLVGGGGVPMHADSGSPEGETHEIAPGKAYTVTFNEPDLWGDEAKPHPRGLYRVVFLFYHELTIEEAPLGNLACPLRANPLTFAEK